MAVAIVPSLDCFSPPKTPHPFRAAPVICCCLACRRIHFALALFAVGVVAAAQGEEAAPLTRYSRTELHMGVEFEVVLYAADAAKADEALTKAMARIAALDKTLSDYDPESELSKLSETSVVAGDVARAAFPAVRVSDDLWNVLQQ